MEKAVKQERVTKNIERAALLAGALWTASPTAANAWETERRFSNEAISQALAEAGLPAAETLNSTEVTHVIPAANGQYIVQIRMVHKDPLNTPTVERWNEVVAVQKDVYASLRQIVAESPLVTFYREGTARGEEKKLEQDKQLRKDFSESVKVALEQHGKEIDAQQLMKDFTDRLGLLGRTVLPETIEKYAALLRDNMFQSGAIISESNGRYFDQVIKHVSDGHEQEPWLYYNGALDMAYYQGFVEEVRGCEDTELMSSVYLQEGDDAMSDKIIEINKQREVALVQCVVEDLERSGDRAVVLPYGGAHNLSQEIEEYGNGTGYIVLTPQQYPAEKKFRSLD